MHCINGWISVKDRLPDLNEYVLGYCQQIGLLNRFVEMVRKNGNVKTGWWCDRYDEAVKVTHWQPLPEPPKC